MTKNWADYVKPADMSVAFLWTNWAGLVIPADASQLQRDEMKKAFYSGFLESYKLMNDYIVKLSEAQAVQLLSKLDGEAREFFEQMFRDHGRHL